MAAAKELTRNEIATVLAALRYWQKALQSHGAENDSQTPILAAAIYNTFPQSEHFSHGAKPLTLPQIDELCEAINVPPIEGLNPLNAEAARIAKEKYADPSNDIEIDDGPRFSDAMPEGVWVSAWLWVDGADLREVKP